jgi:hypothetical protein
MVRNVRAMSICLGMIVVGGVTMLPGETDEWIKWAKLIMGIVGVAMVS